MAQLLDASEAGSGPLAGADCVDCALRLQQSGYSTAALSGDGRVGPWHVRLAALQGETGGTGHRQEHVQQRHGGCAACAAAGEAGAAAGLASGVIAGSAPASGSVVVVGGGGSGGGAESGGSSSSGVVLGRDALEYLRKGCRHAMMMRAEHDLPPLLLGTSEVRSACFAAGGNDLVLVVSGLGDGLI